MPLSVADAQRIVIRNGQSLMAGRLGLQNDMAAFLMRLAITPIAAQHLDQLRAA
jgi:hypothetical protein